MFYWVYFSCALVGKQSKIKFAIPEEERGSTLVATSSYRFYVIEIITFQEKNNDCSRICKKNHALSNQNNKVWSQLFMGSA